MPSNDIDARTLQPGRARPDQASPATQAVDCDGLPYDGDLVCDVRDYRRLLTRSLRGPIARGEELERLHALEARLRVRPPLVRESGFTTSDRRFFCSIPSAVRSASTDLAPAVTIDFGADGAQILSYRHSLLVNSIVWLFLDVLDEGPRQRLAFTCRVHWSSDDYAGLLFTSARSPSERELGRIPFARYPSDQVERIRAAIGPVGLH